MHPALGGQRGLKGDTSMPRRRHLCTNGPQPCGSPATNSLGHWQVTSGLHSSSIKGRFGQMVRNVSCSLSPAPDV